MSTLVRNALSSLPHGRTLSDDAWAQRHRWMLWLLWGNVAGLFAFGLAQGEAPLHVGLDAGVIALLAAAGLARRRDRRSGSAAVALGLLTSSAVAVHLSHGAIEAHFHFFVVIAALSLYEDWLPFGLAAGFVLLHHALLGALVPQSVFSHDDAIAHPLRWALVHAGFVAAAGGVNVLAWRLHEDTRGRLRGLATIVESSHDAILSLDTAGRLLSWNGGASRVFGFADHEVLGRHIEVLLVDEHAGGDARMLERLLHGDHVQEHESVWRDRSGARIDVRLSASPLRDAHGMVTGASAIVQDVTERRRAADELRSSREALAHQAMHDALTGLPNRLLLHDRLEKALQRSRRTGSRVALLFLDVDRFKVVNDSLGHAAGDDLLVRMAARLDEAVRASDTLARFGGDEMAILCEDLEHERGAVEVAERVVAALARPILIDGREVLATASVGVALSDGGETDAGTLLRDADAAMYRAKELGGARYELFDTDMRARSLERMQIDHELRLAIGRGELRLHFQPVVALGDGTVVGAEALVRWQHPTRGLLAPAAFVPIAEESALIVALGEWVLRDACRQLSAWEPLLPEGFVLAINVSARQFAEPAFVDVVRAALDEAGASPARLAIELTESSLMQQEGAEDVLLALRALGVRLVMDDFGTGYSSLSYLSRFELDGLKIDRSFVAKMSDGSPEHAIIAAVGTMAGAMDLHVVAEGVETPDQQEALHRLGYQYGQGFLFARPMDAGAFTGVLGGRGADQGVAGSSP